MKKIRFNRRRFFLRLMCLPFWFSILIISHIYIAVIGSLLYLVNGGEIINHLQDDKPSIYKIYNELKNKK